MLAMKARDRAMAASARTLMASGAGGCKPMVDEARNVGGIDGVAGEGAVGAAEMAD